MNLSLHKWFENPILRFGPKTGVEPEWGIGFYNYRIFKV